MTKDDDMYQGHPRWNSFDEERAMRKSGDDRAAFLRFEGSELLYWWHVLDKYELIQFTAALLSDHSGVSSNRTPPQTARPKQKKLKTDSSTTTTSHDDPELHQ